MWNRAIPSNIWEFINNFLAAIGLISLVLTAVRIFWTFFRSSEWSNNVRIEEYPLDKDLDAEKGIYPQYYPIHPSLVESEYATQNLFIPQNTVFRKVVLKKAVSHNNFESFHYVKEHTFREVSPTYPLCLVIERTEAIPMYQIEWKADYGACGTYDFGDNLRSGDNSLTGLEYHFGILAKIRVILGLR